jgi:hypothetical protein
MTSEQLTVLFLEISALLLLLLYLGFYAAEKLKRMEKRGVFAVAPRDAGILYRSLCSEIGHVRLRQFSAAVFTLLVMALVFCVSYLDVSRDNYVVSLIVLLCVSSLSFYMGVWLILSAMYRARENRVMLHKFMYRSQSASGKVLAVNILRQSLYYLDKKAFERKRKSDFSLKPDAAAVFMIAALAAAQSFNIVYLVDLLSPL